MRFLLVTRSINPAGIPRKHFSHLLETNLKSVIFVFQIFFLEKDNKEIEGENFKNHASYVNYEWRLPLREKKGDFIADTRAL